MLPDVSGITCGHSGVFRRASEWMRNNFAVHCGILMVYCWNVLFYFYVALLLLDHLSRRYIAKLLQAWRFRIL